MLGLQKRKYPFQTFNLKPFANTKANLLSPKNIKIKMIKKSVGAKFATKNNHPENRLTCCYCKYAIHTKSAVYKSAKKVICNECQSDMFPFTNI